MKLNTSSAPEAQVYGDIASNRVSIDVKNLDFITQILSSNLYSKPLNSFLREIVSNAVDSHKEAGTTDPIILDIGKANGKYYIRIQDFGTGISRERFNQIYKFIGSSTKRESDDYIGSFGLGRFSALSVSDSCTITSVYNGEKVKYLMYKDGMAINIDELSSEKTTERNGIEVYVQPNVEIDYSRLKSCLQDLAFFDNVYINLNLKEQNSGYYSYSYMRFKELQDFVNQFNNKKNLTYKSFRVSGVELSDESCILLGNVMYRIDYAHKNDRLDGWKNAYGNVRLVPKFNIGELSVTPNREDLLYDSKTEASLKKRFAEVDNELADLVKKDLSGDQDYNILKTISVSRKYTFEDADDSLKDVQNVELKEDAFFEILSKNCTFLGQKLTSKEISKLSYLCGAVYPFYTIQDYDGRIIRVKTKDVNIKYLLQGTNNWRNTKFFKRDYRVFNWYLKQWTKENYKSFTIIEPYDIKKIYRDFWRYNDSDGYTKKVKKIYAKYVMDAYNNLPAISDSVITPEYKAQFSTAGLNTSSENVNITYFRGYNTEQKKMKISEFLEDKDTLNIYFTEAENLIPKDLCTIPTDILKKDSDISSYKRIYFVQVGEKTKKAIAHEDNVMYYTEILNPDRYWMKFIRTWEEVKNKEWYKVLCDCYSHYGGLSKAAIKIIKDFCKLESTYEEVRDNLKYTKAFSGKIDILQDVIDSITPTESVINCISLSKTINRIPQSDMYKLFAASIPNVDADDTVIEQYQKLIKLYSKDDKEHNKNQQVPERDA